MIYFFPESSSENPLSFFEFVYSEKGQRHLKREFLSDEFDLDNLDEPKFDLEKDTFPYIDQDIETGELTEIHYSFKDYLNQKFNRERSKSYNQFAKRIDACNSTSEEAFVLEKFHRILERCLVWVSKNHIPLKNGHIKNIQRLKSDLELTFKYRTGLSFESLDMVEIEKLKKIISELSFIQNADNDNFLHFLLCDNINSFTAKIQVRCDNRQFHYILDKFISIGFPVSFGMKEIIKSKIFLRDSDSKPFTASNIYNVSSKNKLTAPKKVKEIDEIFSLF